MKKRRKPPSVLFEAEVWTVTPKVRRKESHRTLSKLLWRKVSDKFFLALYYIQYIIYILKKTTTNPITHILRRLRFVLIIKNKYFRIQFQRQKPNLTTPRNKYTIMDALYTKTHFSFVILTYFTKPHQETLLIWMRKSGQLLTIQLDYLFQHCLSYYCQLF